MLAKMQSQLPAVCVCGSQTKPKYVLAFADPKKEKVVPLILNQTLKQNPDSTFLVETRTVYLPPYVQRAKVLKRQGDLAEGTDVQILEVFLDETKSKVITENGKEYEVNRNDLYFNPEN